MPLMLRIVAFFKRPFFNQYKTLFCLWFLLSIAAWIPKVVNGTHNNFQIFRGVFYHLSNCVTLYGEYPLEYKDVNLYGPLFSIIIAPFAIVPLWLGLLMWLCTLSIVLFYSIKYLNIDKASKIFIYWFCAHELLTALFMSQFNIAIAAIIIVAYAALEKKKEWLAALVIVIGLFVKIYGVVGLAFFFFSKDKIKFIFWLLVWSCIAFVLPMIFSSYQYILDQYQNWFCALQEKSGKNLFSTHQNISLLGMIRKISGSQTYSDIYPIGAGLFLFGLPYLRFSQFKYKVFRLSLLASVLLFVVLFSTGSESSSYITALLGVSIWYICSENKKSYINIFLLIFAFLLTSMSPSDLFPAYIRKTWVMPYALKALPCAIIWFKLIYEMCTRDYKLINYEQI